jgi:large subunit ribosomal protein L23
MTPHEVLRRPVITEKNTQLNEQSRYVFEVAREANKLQIKQAVEVIFKVTVTAVNTINVPSKPRRFGRSVGRTKPWKKAIVSLAKGQRIELFPAV